MIIIGEEMDGKWRNAARGGGGKVRESELGVSVEKLKRINGLARNGGYVLSS